MIGKSTLKKYGFEYLFNYFDYIIDSQLNGNNSQVKELYKKLSKDQKELFYFYLKKDRLDFNYKGLF